MSTPLRWSVGLLTGGCTVGLVALIILGNGFRRSFGASENSGLKVGVTFLILGALIASVAWPQQRMLMHAVAAVVLFLAAASVWIWRESSFMSLAGLTFCGLWSAYYWQATSTP